MGLPKSYEDTKRCCKIKEKRALDTAALFSCYVATTYVKSVIGG